MRKTIRLLAITLLFNLPVYALQSGQTQQASTNVKGSTMAQAQSDDKSASAALDAGAQIETEMASSLDLRKAKPGDPFKMKTTRPVKRDGKEVISRGSVITGRVEQVTRADNQTTARLVFDSIEDKKTHATAPLQATVSAITAATGHVASSGSDDAMMSPPSRQSAPRQQSGGLLGGVTNTVGGVTGAVGDVTGTVGATADAATRTTLGANGLGRGAIQIVSDTTATATSGSTLQATGKNARIDSGTAFILQTTSAVTFLNQANAPSKDKPSQ